MPRLVSVLIKRIDPLSGAPSIFSSSLTLSFTACLILSFRFSSSFYCDTETNMGSHTSDENIYLLARDEAETERYVPLALKCALLELAFNRETRKPLPLEVTPFSGVSLSYHSQHIISTLRHAPSPSTPPVSHTVTLCRATYPCQCQLSQQVPWAQVDVDGANAGVPTVWNPICATSTFLQPVSTADQSTDATVDVDVDGLWLITDGAADFSSLDSTNSIDFCWQSPEMN